MIVGRIYHGDTEIVSVYQNRVKIWSAGEDKHLVADLAKILSSISAYITHGALSRLNAEQAVVSKENVSLWMQKTIELGQIEVVLLINVSGHSSSSENIPATLVIRAKDEIDVHASLSKVVAIDLNMFLKNDLKQTSSPSAPIISNRSIFSTEDIENNASPSKAHKVFMVNTVWEDVEARKSPSCPVVIDENETVFGDLSANASPSASVETDTSVQTAGIIRTHISRTVAETVDEVIQSTEEAQARSSPSESAKVAENVTNNQKVTGQSSPTAFARAEEPLEVGFTGIGRDSQTIASNVNSRLKITGEFHAATGQTRAELLNVITNVDGDSRATQSLVVNSEIDDLQVMNGDSEVSVPGSRPTELQSEIRDTSNANVNCSKSIAASCSEQVCSSESSDVRVSKSHAGQMNCETMMMSDTNGITSSTKIAEMKGRITDQLLAEALIRPTVENHTSSQMGLDSYAETKVSPGMPSQASKKIVSGIGGFVITDPSIVSYASTQLSSYNDTTLASAETISGVYQEGITGGCDGEIYQSPSVISTADDKECFGSDVVGQATVSRIMQYGDDLELCADTEARCSESTLAISSQNIQGNTDAEVIPSPIHTVKEEYKILSKNGSDGHASSSKPEELKIGVNTKNKSEIISSPSMSGKIDFEIAGNENCDISMDDATILESHETEVCGYADLDLTTLSFVLKTAIGQGFIAESDIAQRHDPTSSGEIKQVMYTEVGTTAIADVSKHAAAVLAVDASHSATIDTSEMSAGVLSKTIRNGCETVIHESSFQDLLAETRVSHATNANIINGVFRRIGKSETACRSGCNVTLSFDVEAEVMDLDNMRITVIDGLPINSFDVYLVKVK